MPRASGVSNIAYTSYQGLVTANRKLSIGRYGDSRQIRISRDNTSSPYSFLESFDGGESWSTMVGSEITAAMIATAGNPQTRNMRFFHTLNGFFMWVYQTSEVVFNPNFQINYTLYFHFSTDNGVTWTNSPITLARGTLNEIDSMIVISPTGPLGSPAWMVSFPDTNQTWVISSPTGTYEIQQLINADGLSIISAAKIEEREFENGWDSSDFTTILDKDGSDPSSNVYNNLPPLFLTSFPGTGIIYPKAVAYLDNTFGILGFNNGFRLQQSTDAEGTSWSGLGDPLNFNYTDDGNTIVSHHLLPLIEDEINDQKWFLPYIVKTGGLSAPYSYTIGSIYDNSISDETVTKDLRFENHPRFTSDRAAKSVLMMADNKLYHVSSRNVQNQLPVFQLLETFASGFHMISEYVGPRIVTENFDRNPSLMDGTLRGWGAKNNQVYSTIFPYPSLGPLAKLNYDSGVSKLRFQLPSGNRPSFASTQLSYEFRPPFWWQGSQFGEYVKTLFGFNIEVLAPNGETATANIRLTTNGILDTDNPTTINAPSPLTDDRFGQSVAGGFQYIAIGSPFHNNINNDPDVGVVDIFDLEYNYIRSIPNPDPSYFDNGAGITRYNQKFGSNLLIANSFSANTPSDQYLIVSSPYHDTEHDFGGGTFRLDSEGQVYVFDITDGSLVHTLKTTAAIEAEPVSQFGYAIVLRGTSVLIGAPGWNSGEGRVFEFDITTGQQISTIPNPDPSNISQFGYSISGSDFGSVYISSYNNGTDGKVYRYGGFGTLALQETFSAPDAGATGFGFSILSGGAYTYISAPGYNSNSGRVYAYFSDFTTELVKTIENPNDSGVSTDDRFGEQMVQSSSNKIMISAPGEDDGGNASGKVYIIQEPNFRYDPELNDTVHSDPFVTQTLTNPNAFNLADNDEFGKTIAASSFGILIAAPGDDGGVTKTSAGTVFSYQSEDVIFYDQTFIRNSGTTPQLLDDVLVELPGAISSEARLEIDVTVTGDAKVDIYGLKFRPTSGIPPDGRANYTTEGTYQWTAPAGVTFVNVVAIGGGAAGDRASVGRWGGGGGGLGWANNIPVTPGQTYTVRVGAGGTGDGGPPGGDSYFIDTSTVAGLGGLGRDGGGLGGGWVGQGGGNGGNGGQATGSNLTGGGGGAGGYNGNGGNGGGGGQNGSPGQGSSGAGGGGAGSDTDGAPGGGGGGGTFYTGLGSTGQGGTFGSVLTRGGEGGSDGADGYGTYQGGGVGGQYGGGGGMGTNSGGLFGGNGGGGAVSIVWGLNRTFPFDVPPL